MHRFDDDESIDSSLAEEETVELDAETRAAYLDSSFFSASSAKTRKSSRLSVASGVSFLSSHSPIITYSQPKSLQRRKSTQRKRDSLQSLEDELSKLTVKAIHPGKELETDGEDSEQVILLDATSSICNNEDQRDNEGDEEEFLSAMEDTPERHDESSRNGAKGKQRVGTEKATIGDLEKQFAAMGMTCSPPRRKALGVSPLDSDVATQFHKEQLDSEEESPFHSNSLSETELEKTLTKSTSGRYHSDVEGQALTKDQYIPSSDSESEIEFDEHAKRSSVIEDSESEVEFDEHAKRSSEIEDSESEIEFANPSTREDSESEVELDDNAKRSSVIEDSESEVELDDNAKRSSVIEDSESEVELDDNAKPTAHDDGRKPFAVDDSDSESEFGESANRKSIAAVDDESESEFELEDSPERRKGRKQRGEESSPESVAWHKSNFITPAQRNTRPRRATSSRVNYHESSPDDDEDDEGETNDGEDLLSEEEEEEEGNLDKYESSFVVSSDDENDEETQSQRKARKARKSHISISSASDESYLPSNSEEEEEDDEDEDDFVPSDMENCSEKPHPKSAERKMKPDMNPSKVVLTLSDSSDEEEYEDEEDAEAFSVEEDDLIAEKENDANQSNRKAADSAQEKKKKSTGETLTPQNRDQVVQALFKEYNETVFDGKLDEKMSITWNTRLRKTAGLTYTSRRGTTKISEVQLSTKVVDSVFRLKETLLHELCHVAAWHVQGKCKPPHGPAFKYWANVATALYPEYQVTTCHSYKIHAKYRYECVDCKAVFARHSKSINVQKQLCGRCRGRIEFKGTCGKDGTPRQPRKQSEYQKFVKLNYTKARELVGGGDNAAVMRMLGEMWKEKRAQES